MSACDRSLVRYRVNPGVTPEEGVTRYMHDLTQGPACAIAAGATSIWRNFFVPVDGETGQTATARSMPAKRWGRRYRSG